MTNDLDLVRRVITLLESHGIEAWLAGGWAEALRGLSAPRPHRDIDLVVRGCDFATVDRFLATGITAEIPAKRSRHKRAFVLEGIMTEVLLVGAGLVTRLDNGSCFAWPNDSFARDDGTLRIVSTSALRAYRASHFRLHGAATT